MKLEETKSIYIYISMHLYINIAIYIYLSLYIYLYLNIYLSRRAGRCILRRRDSRCVVSERHRAGVLGLGCPMHGELARPASPHEVGEGALTAVCPPAGPNLPAAQ